MFDSGMLVIDQELQARAGRLLDGHGRIEDLDRLFLDQRERSHGRASFRELGDFLAHRDQRTKGPVTQRVRDVFTSFRVWSMPLRSLTPSPSDLLDAGKANLRLYSDAEIAAFGTHREAANTKINKIIRKLEAGHPPSANDKELFHLIVNRFVWRPAFTGDELFNDFEHVLLKNRIIAPENCAALAASKDLISLYAVSRLHGSAIKIEDGMTGKLIAGFANADGVIEVKVDVGGKDWIKPVQAPICIFLTSLDPKKYCAPNLMPQSGMSAWDAWSYPIEIAEDGRLSAIK